MGQVVLRLALEFRWSNKHTGSLISLRDFGPIELSIGYYTILFLFLIPFGVIAHIYGSYFGHSLVSIALICGGPFCSIASMRYCLTNVRYRALLTGVVLFLLSSVVLIGAEVVDVLGVRPSGMPLIKALYLSGAATPIGGLIGLICLGISSRIAFGDPEPFTRANAAALGDARWLPMDQVRRLFPSDGEIVIGEAYRPDREPGGKSAFSPSNQSSWGSGGRAELMTFNLDFDSTHMLFFAGSGGFKTTSTVVPTALRYRGSMVVLDPACEVGALVSEHRKAMGRRVKLLDPMASNTDLGVNETGRPGCNVLAPLLRSLNVMPDTVAFARLLVAETVKEGGGSSAYFEAQAHNLMTGLLFFVLCGLEFNQMLVGEDLVPRTPTLADLRTLTAMSEVDLKKKIGTVVGLSLADLVVDADESWLRFLQQTLSSYVNMADQTWTGIASSVAKDTQWLSIPTLAAMVCNQTFAPSELLAGDLDVFIQIPGELLKSYPGVGRTLIGAFAKTMIDAKGTHKSRVLLVLDEVDLLGYMGLLEEIRDRGRKYGLTLMMMYQSVGQLEKHFGKPGAISWFEGCSFASYASIKSMETAKALSTQCGDVTVEVEGRSASSSWLEGPLSLKAGNNRLTASVSLQKRPLILPHEIREMRSDEQILMVRGYPAIRAGRAIYFRRPEMAELVASNRFK